MTTAPNFSHIALDNLCLKLANTRAEIEAAQNCRYQVFYEELGAHPIGQMAALKRDYDDFDPVCDHLLVLDTNKQGAAQVVGTYRMLRHSVAANAGIGLYTETEFDLSLLKAKAASENADIIEFSRSCVLPDYRGRLVINLLWKGIAAYVLHYGIKYITGVPSFQGTNLASIMPQMAYLQHNYLASADIRPVALPNQYQPIIPFDPTTMDTKAIIKNLPPLIKGYLRSGAVFGQGCVVDAQFNTIDMCMVLDFAQVNEKHLQYYSRQE
jgi:L-ornithine Nalpha-acyltransferase